MIILELHHLLCQQAVLEGSGREEERIGKELGHITEQLQGIKSAQRRLLMQNQEKRRKISEVPSLLQKLKLKKKEIKLTRQKVQVLELENQRYETIFSELRATLPARL